MVEVHAHPVLPVVRGLLVSLDLLVAGLTVTAVVQAEPPRVLAGLLGAAFAALYAWGRRTVRVHEAPMAARRGTWWPAGAWITGLVLLWVALLVVSPAALWLAFPLTLLEMHVLGPHRGVAAVGLTTAVAVVAGLLGRSATDAVTGFVLGPVVGAAVAVAVTLGLEALARESEERRRTVEELSTVREHLAAAEREAAVLGERERLAREIHDTLAQGFSAIELLLRAADATDDPERARGYAAQARTAAQENLDEARRFVRALAPADLEGATLAAALRRVAERAQETAAASGGDDALRVRVSTGGEPRALSVPVEAALVRVAQTALANVVQHAGAGKAAVTLTYLDDEVLLDVVDDGRGFDPARVAGHGRAGGFGLVAIASRVAELGGTSSIESRPGEGTAVAVRLPVVEPSPAEPSPPEASGLGPGEER